MPAAEADARIFEYFMYYSTFEYVMCYSKLLFELSPVTCESRVSRIVIFLLDLDLEAFSFHFSFSMSRHFHFTFYFSKRVKAFQISLFFSRKKSELCMSCHEKFKKLIMYNTNMQQFHNGDSLFENYSC